jgi:type IV pilus assembly PilX-like protein
MKIHSQSSTHCEEAREAMSDKNRDRRHEGGFALILAILALMLLTFLGLTLATTTSTELRIATNYRWNTQALYNAEAGIEAGKRILQGVSWLQVLPQKRTDWNPSATLPLTAPVRTDALVPGSATAGTRNFEMGDCDRQGNGMGYGKVLYDGTNVYENITIVPGFTSPPALNGAFTLWIRRPIVRSTDATKTFADDDDAGLNDTMILTAEGIAPYAGAASSTLTRSNVARRIIEVSVKKQDTAGPCAGRSGQIGGGPEGNNVFGGVCGGDINNAVADLSFAPGGKTRITP